MRTANIDIVLNQGTDWKKVILIPSDDGPINLTGYSFFGQMRETTGSAIVAEFDFTILDQSIPANVGKVEWSLDKTISDALLLTVAGPECECRTKTPFLYDVKMTDSLGQVSRLIQGRFFVSPTVSREVIL